MSMSSQFQLIDCGWQSQFTEASMLKTDELLIVSPFIKLKAARRLTAGKKRIRVLTRFALNHFLAGASDLSALRHLLDANAEVRGIKHLHAKVYTFGRLRSMVTSANLTEAALTRNHELGFVSDDPAVVQSCREYFEKLWDRAQKSLRLTHRLIDQWEEEIRPLAAAARAAANTGLADFGADLGFLPELSTVPDDASIGVPAFVKFLGKADNRADLRDAILDQVVWSEANWAVSYPKGRRPRRPKTGDIMFIGRMVHSPNDIIVFGRATAYEHVPSRDDASDEEVKRCGWKKQWPHYIRLREPEFIDGPLANGISLNRMMLELGAQSFASTAEHAHAGSGNQDPRKAMMQKPHMLLSAESANWLNSRFCEAARKWGRVPLSELQNLRWPDLPALGNKGS